MSDYKLMFNFYPPPALATLYCHIPPCTLLNPADHYLSTQTTLCCALLPPSLWTAFQELHSLASTISKVCTGLALRAGTRGIQNPAAKMNLNAIDPQCTVGGMRRAAQHWSVSFLFSHTLPPTPLTICICMAQVLGLSACPLTRGDTFAAVSLLLR